jgi:hypothetical protein
LSPAFWRIRLTKSPHRQLDMSYRPGVLPELCYVESRAASSSRESALATSSWPLVYFGESDHPKRLKVPGCFGRKCPRVSGNVTGAGKTRGLVSGAAPGHSYSVWLARSAVGRHLRGGYGSWRGVDLGEQIDDGHRFVAMRARRARAEPTSEHAAVIAALLSKQARFTFGALVHDAGPRQTCGQPEPDLVHRRLATTKAALTARVRAVGLTAVWHEAASTSGRTLVFWSRQWRIVTQRGVPPLADVGAWRLPSVSDGGRCERGGPGWHPPRSDRHLPARDASSRPAIG